MRSHRITLLILLHLLLFSVIDGQQTNPVDRQVANPITDTPNVNPVSAQQDLTPPKGKRPTFEAEGGGDELVVYSRTHTVEGEEGKRIISHSGDVDVRYEHL